MSRFLSSVQQQQQHRHRSIVGLSRATTTITSASGRRYGGVDRSHGYHSIGNTTNHRDGIIFPTIVSSSSSSSLPSTTNSTYRYLSSNLHHRKDSSSSSSIFQNASDFWISLRLKAANALTASLSPQEREELLNRMMINNNTNNKKPTMTSTTPMTTGSKNDTVDDNLVEDSKTNSIAEAIAAARAEEAVLQRSKWEKEKDSIIQAAELAATQRIENELKIQQRRLAYEKWQLELQQEEAKADVSSKNDNTNIVAEATAETPMTTLSPETSSLTTNDDTQKLKEEENNVHPLLGSVVADLGYKRIYMVSASVLSTIPVWKKQRIYRHDRVKSMANDKLKTLHLGLPGIIALYEDSNGALSILDGQHRVGMITVLQEKLLKDKNDTHFNMNEILVEVYTNNSSQMAVVPTTNNNDEDNNNIDEKYATELFLEVNKAEPVKLVDMPGIAKKGDRKIITSAADTLQQLYPEMFSSSQKCRPPHLNIDNLRDAIFASGCLLRHSITSSKQLQDWMIQQNNKLHEKYSTMDVTTVTKQTNISKTAFEKASKYQFYLGLESGWLYE